MSPRAVDELVAYPPPPHSLTPPPPLFLSLPSFLGLRWTVGGDDIFALQGCPRPPNRLKDEGCGGGEGLKRPLSFFLHTNTTMFRSLNVRLVSFEPLLICLFWGKLPVRHISLSSELKWVDVNYLNLTLAYFTTLFHIHQNCVLRNYEFKCLPIFLYQHTAFVSIKG